MSIDNEASRGGANFGITLEGGTTANQDVSFVLERKHPDTINGGGSSKLGLFSIALVMCVCCLSSIFGPIGNGTTNALTNGSMMTSGQKVVQVIGGTFAGGQ